MNLNADRVDSLDSTALMQAKSGHTFIVRRSFAPGEGDSAALTLPGLGHFAMSCSVVPAGPTVAVLDFVGGSTVSGMLSLVHDGASGSLFFEHSHTTGADSDAGDSSGTWLITSGKGTAARMAQVGWGAHATAGTGASCDFWLYASEANG
jgi:hypothetical protein